MGWWVVDVLYRRGVPTPPLPCGGYYYPLLYVCYVKESIEVLPRLEFGGVLAPLLYVVVKRFHFCQ